MAIIKFDESSLIRFICMQVTIMFKAIPTSMVVCRHMKKSNEISKGKYSSWTQWWKDNIMMPIVPKNKKCPCCQRIIKEDKSNYFVIGYVKVKNNKYLTPVCNDCNVKMKKWKFLVNRDRLVDLPTNL